MTSPVDDAGPVEAFLDELVKRLPPDDPRRLRRVLAEAEAHLRDDTARSIADGLPQLEAEAEAVRRFGPAEDLAGAEQQRAGTPLRRVVRQFVTTGLMLGGVGAVAVGLSGLVAAVFWVIGGNGAVTAVSPGQQLQQSDCARWLAADPAARSCQDAAVADWAAETVVYRIALGLLGVAALFAFRLLRRQERGAARWPTLPAPVIDAIAATVFSLAAVATVALGVDAFAVDSGHGTGQWLSAAVVSLAAASLFGRRLVSDLLAPAPGTTSGRT